MSGVARDTTTSRSAHLQQDIEADGHEGPDCRPQPVDPVVAGLQRRVSAVFTDSFSAPLTKEADTTLGPKLLAGLMPQPVYTTPNMWQARSVRPMPTGARYVLLCFSAASRMTVRTRMAVRKACWGQHQCMQGAHFNDGPRTSMKRPWPTLTPSPSVVITLSAPPNGVNAAMRPAAAIPPSSCDTTSSPARKALTPPISQSARVMALRERVSVVPVPPNQTTSRVKETTSHPVKDPGGDEETHAKGDRDEHDCLSAATPGLVSRAPPAILRRPHTWLPSAVCSPSTCDVVRVTCAVFAPPRASTARPESQCIALPSPSLLTHRERGWCRQTRPGRRRDPA